MRGIVDRRPCRPLALWLALSFVAVLPALAAGAPPAGAPAEVKIGFVDFLSGPAVLFGASGRNTAQLLVDQYNQGGGIRGVKIKLAVVDEAGGPDKQVTEFRRLALDEKVHAIVGYTSSANCLAVAPVAEELRVLTVIHICGTRRLTEDKPLKYVFRTSNHQTADSVMLARYVLALKPDVKTIAGLNEDYAWGRDSWEDFRAALQQLKPDVTVAAALWTKIQAGEYSAEISKLLAARADVVHTSFWGGGLVTFVKQASPRGLFRQSLVAFSVAEQSLQDLKREMPDGVIAMPRATPGYFLYPDAQANPLQKAFLEGYRARFGKFPDYPAYRTYFAFSGLKAALEKAVDQAGGKWPTNDQTIAAFRGLTWQSPVGPVTMRSDHQAVHGGFVGVSKFNPAYGFATLDRVQARTGEEIMPPLGVKAPDWIKTLKR